MTIPREHISAMAAYQLATLDPPDGQPLISLSQNESLRPPSPRALQAAAAVLSATNLYPDPDWSGLRAAIANVHNVQAGQIACGNGSLDLIGALARIFAGAGRAVLAPAHAYPFVRTAAALAEARFDTAPEDGLAVSVSAMLDAVRPDTGLVFIANPGNPTGTRIPRPELLRLRDGLREDILLVIDEAYGEFADHLGEPCFDMVADGRTVILRTFSKAYGMAGFRVGWGLFPPAVLAQLRKVLSPNNISMPAQAAAAAAMVDQVYMRETCDLTAAARAVAGSRLRDCGFRIADSCTNFLLIDLGSETVASDAEKALRGQGVFLRRQAGAGLPGMLRMTIGPEPHMRAAIDELLRWKGRRP